MTMIALPLPVAARKNYRALWRAYALMAPLVLFLLITFVGPIATLLWRGVADTELPDALPQTALALKQWDGRSAPDERLLQPFAQDLRAVSSKDLAAVARRLSYEAPQMRAMLTAAKRSVDSLDGSAQAFATLDPRWLTKETWQTFKRATGPAGSFHVLSALDLKHDYNEGIVSKGEEGLYRSILLRTFAIAAATTVICVLLAFPLCSFLDRRTPRTRNLLLLLLLLILLPFWTSILVRTTAWMVLLQDNGVVNTTLMYLGIIDAPMRLLYNRFGVILALVHVMLPFMVFPLLSAMQSSNKLLIQAAYSMGARPVFTFFRVYLPQVLPGLAAGALMVFIVTLGFYITPALIGGPGDQMISYYIAQFTTGTLNWGLASALGIILLAVTTLLYLIQARLARGRSQGTH
ncbi:putative spermidine/putrescine transport system permease protein [Pseudomonas cedrina]|uniref:Polyamine ABC transporter substrate-binding protein n=2 Tax=Pseudomonas cedrina TaxID=651740 RepID=A0A1V2JWH4_PSECE|nr:ABC transporter permease [Pseudomonas cedrina]ONH49852.1 polyamine ABC transporter substrate-binding protein [Pseudomonas cedrina subsp. cedrina]SDT06874.1 putative spermidine/putrescine transport system permease protein [Pseudomonas cedrina]